MDTNKKSNPPAKDGNADRTTGSGGKASVSRSVNTNNNEDTADTDALDENQKNKLEQEDAGTGLDTNRKQRRG